MSEVAAAERHYATPFWDSGRWRDFAVRDGDIIVCTSYKAGTTWTQMICALLVHQSPDLPLPMSRLSPWLDMRTAPIAEIAAELAAQPWRRVIKTHTALDGLPLHDQAVYVFCGRDPRDVFMSMQGHMANADFEKFAVALARDGVEMSPPPPLPDDLDERFALWMNVATFPWEKDGLPFWSHFHHAETFWARRTAANIHFLHYADLKADLEGQMRRLAAALGIVVDEAKWPALVKAASFADMKANAERTAPDVHNGIWLDNAAFFKSGENAQWRGALSAESLGLYHRLKRERYDTILVDWLERGSRAAGDPKGL